MNTREPKFRCGTAKAIYSVVIKFNLPHEEWMQDFPIEISDAEKIEDYFGFYDQVTDDDEKFVLMELLIQATTEQPTSWDLYHSWLELKQRLIQDFLIHEYTVYYWCCFDNKDIEECWSITPYMRELWYQQKYSNRRDKLKSLELAEIIANELKDYGLINDNEISEAIEKIEYIIDTRKSLNDY